MRATRSSGPRGALWCRAHRTGGGRVGYAWRAPSHAVHLRSLQLRRPAFETTHFVAAATALRAVTRSCWRLPRTAAMYSSRFRDRFPSSSTASNGAARRSCCDPREDRAGGLATRSSRRFGTSTVPTIFSACNLPAGAARGAMIAVALRSMSRFLWSCSRRGRAACARCRHGRRRSVFCGASGRRHAGACSLSRSPGSNGTPATHSSLTMAERSEGGGRCFGLRPDPPARRRSRRAAAPRMALEGREPSRKVGPDAQEGDDYAARIYVASGSIRHVHRCRTRETRHGKSDLRRRCSACSDQLHLGDRDARRTVLANAYTDGCA